MNVDVISQMLNEIQNDRTVPKNVRELIQTVIETLRKSNVEDNIKISTSVSILDEVSNDSNIPIYTRTQVWNIVSMLESMEAMQRYHK
ncbi:MAG: UPF0147 family protein [Candidatus Aenigmarchaeota archaeon]|nr:UPF0147 family protein [Candidatus Aenigmarchaeota archaeon]